MTQGHVCGELWACRGTWTCWSSEPPASRWRPQTGLRGSKNCGNCRRNLNRWRDLGTGRQSSLHSQMDPCPKSELLQASKSPQSSGPFSWETHSFLGSTRVGTSVGQVRELQAGRKLGTLWGFFSGLSSYAQLGPPLECTSSHLL